MLLKGNFLYDNQYKKDFISVKRGDILLIKYLILLINKKKYYYNYVTGICLKKKKYNGHIFIKICQFYKYQRFYYYLNINGPLIINVKKLIL